MPNQETLYAVKDRIATITFNRPDKLNAWTAVMDDEVRASINQAEQDDDVRVIVLTGAGRGFCAGADMALLGNIVENGVGDQESRMLRGQTNGSSRPGVRADFQKKYSYFPSIQKPVIAAINGPAVGLGFILAMYCDLRFAADNAKFGTAFARRGLIAEYGLAWLLPRIIGHAHALDLLLSARIIDSQEALRMGVVNRVYPQDQFLDNVNAYARELAGGVSPRSLRIIKNQVYNGLFQTLDEALASASEEMVQSLQCEDFKEGVAHFMEKRAPAFTGR
jgi:enoyl-CoA hydratase/carnithine racemase